MAFYDFEVGDYVEFLEDYSKNVKKGDRGTVTAVERGLAGFTAAVDGEDTMIRVRMDSGHLTGAFRRRLKRLEAVVTAVEKPVSAESFLEKVKTVSNLYGNRRPLGPIMLQLQEELGELSTEVAIAQGSKNRTPSVDGVLGEAVDVAIVALDIAILESGGDIDLIMSTIEKKLAKWSSYK